MFGEIVRGYRRRLGLTQEELAETTGVSVRGIGKIEAGRSAAPRSVTVRLLADAFSLRGPDRDEFLQAAAGETAEVPAQLPADAVAFAGRVGPLKQLDALLAEPWPAAVVVAAITGTAGVGKTALAVHWAHRVRHRFDGGQLYVNLRGYAVDGSALHATDALRGFLDALEVPPQRIPADLDARASLYRSVLTGRRVLLVLDDARDAEQVRPLLPGSPGCVVVVTSRNRLGGLVAIEGARPLPLELMSPEEARDLLAGRLDAERMASEPDAVDEIATRCAGLPLALAIVAARAATQHTFPLAALAAELRGIRPELDAFASDDPIADVRTVLSSSYRALGDPAARLFRLLGLHPGPDVGEPAVASLAGLAPRRLRPLLAELTGAHLLTEPTPGRYAFHDLLRTYANELALTVDTPSERRYATHRLLDHYLHSAYAAARLLDPHREAIALAVPRAGVSAVDLTGREQALAWFVAEHRTLLAVFEQASAARFDRHTWQLAWCLTNFLDRQGHWHHQAATQQCAIDAAIRLPDPVGHAHSERGVGRAYARLGRYDDAHRHLTRSVDLFGGVGDHTGQAHTHLDQGWVCARQDQHRLALGHAERALDLYQRAGHPGQADALNAVGWYHAQLGDQAQAIVHCQQALVAHRAAGNRHSEANAWDSLGYAYQQLGDHQRAGICYRYAIERLREDGDRYNEAVTLNRLGDTHRAAGASRAAHDAWRWALDILDELEHPDADQVRVKLEQLSVHNGR